MKDRILSQVFEEETVEEKNSHKKELKAAPEPNEIKPLQKKRNQWLLPLVAALLLISAAGNMYFLSNEKEQAEEPVRVVATKSLASAASPKTTGAFSVIEHNGKKERVVSAAGLKGPLDSSAVYQVWLIKGKHPLKQITKGEGTVTYVFSEKEASESWDTVAVPLESKKDNKLPQGPVVLSAAFLIAKGTFRQMKRSTYGGGIHENNHRKRPISLISQTCIDCLLFFSVSVRCTSPLYPATIIDRPHRSFYDS